MDGDLSIRPDKLPSGIIQHEFIICTFIYSFVGFCNGVNFSDQKQKMNPNEKREFYKGLRERIKQLRMGHLFEEPCPLYEPEWEEDHYWDCRLTYDYEEE